MAAAPVLAWSYSRYGDYTQCPAMFKYKHLDKLPTKGSPAMQRGSDIHKEGENWLKTPGKRPLPASYVNFKAEMLQLKGLAPMVEQQWGFTRQWQPTGWFGNDTWLRIICDVAVKYDDGTADIIDFKTGKMYETNKDQVELFSTSPFMKWPEVNEVTTRLWYLDVTDPSGAGDNVVEQEYTRGDFDRIKAGWEKKVQPMFNDRKFAPRPSGKCGWCDFSKAKGGPCKF